jgi:type IV pilus assembly protein PilA
MIVVAILGILAAIAIPAFVTYIRRAKTVEATENVSKMFDLAASYYARERSEDQTIDSAKLEHCSVVAAASAYTPNDQKQTTVEGTSFTGGFNKTTGLGFHTNLVYYAYGISAGTAGLGVCDHSANDDIYRLHAVGDLDADNTTSLFQLSAGSDDQNELYRARTFYIVNETE